MQPKDGRGGGFLLGGSEKLKPVCRLNCLSIAVQRSTQATGQLHSVQAVG